MENEGRAEHMAELFLKLLELLPGLLKRMAGEPALGGDLTPAQLRVLFALKGKREIKMNEMARFLHVTPGTLTVMIDRLCQEGLVERLSAPEDRRSIIVKLTPAGESLLMSFRRELAKHVAHFFTRIPPGERQELVRHLEGTIYLLGKYLSLKG